MLREALEFCVNTIRQIPNSQTVHHDRHRTVVNVNGELHEYPKLDPLLDHQVDDLESLRHFDDPSAHVWLTDEFVTLIRNPETKDTCSVQWELESSAAWVFLTIGGPLTPKGMIERIISNCHTAIEDADPGFLNALRSIKWSHSSETTTDNPHAGNEKMGQQIAREALTASGAALPDTLKVLIPRWVSPDYCVELELQVLLDHERQRVQLLPTNTSLEAAELLCREMLRNDLSDFQAKVLLGTYNTG